MSKRHITKMSEQQIVKVLDVILRELKALVAEMDAVSAEELAFKAGGMDRSVPQPIRVLVTEIVLGAYRERDLDARKRVAELRALADEYEAECKRRGLV